MALTPARSRRPASDKVGQPQRRSVLVPVLWVRRALISGFGLPSAGLLLCLVLALVLQDTISGHPEYAPLYDLARLPSSPVVALTALSSDIAPAVALYDAPEFLPTPPMDSFHPNRSVLARTTLWAYGDSLATGFDESTGSHHPSVAYLAHDLTTVLETEGIRGTVRYQVQARD